MNIDFCLLIIIWNTFVLGVYGADKLRAEAGKKRIRESVLLTLAFLFGGMGAMFGMILFNHKTSKIKFRLSVPIAVILNIVVFYFCFNNSGGF